MKDFKKIFCLIILFTTCFMFFPALSVHADRGPVNGRGQDSTQPYSVDGLEPVKIGDVYVQDMIMLETYHYMFACLNNAYGAGVGDVYKQALATGDYSYYWSLTGTPTYLMTGIFINPNGVDMIDGLRSYAAIYNEYALWSNQPQVATPSQQAATEQQPAAEQQPEQPAQQPVAEQPAQPQPEQPAQQSAAQPEQPATQQSVAEPEPTPEELAPPVSDDTATMLEMQSEMLSEETKSLLAQVEEEEQGQEQETEKKDQLDIAKNDPIEDVTRTAPAELVAETPATQNSFPVLPMVVAVAVVAIIAIVLVARRRNAS